MSLSEVKITDKIEVVSVGTYKVIQVREDNQIHKDGVAISTGNYHRYVLMPDADLTGLDSEVTAIANTVFTQDMKDAYTASQETAE